LPLPFPLHHLNSSTRVRSKGGIGGLLYLSSYVGKTKRHLHSNAARQSHSMLESKLTWQLLYQIHQLHSGRLQSKLCYHPMIVCREHFLAGCFPSVNKNFPPNILVIFEFETKTKDGTACSIGLGWKGVKWGDISREQLADSALLFGNERRF